MDAKTIKYYEILGYSSVKEKWSEFAESEKTKAEIMKKEPLLSEGELKKELRETTQARRLLDLAGLPPVPVIDLIEEYVTRAAAGELLSPEQIEHTGRFLSAVKRLKDYLERGKHFQISLAYYSDNLLELEELEKEIEKAVRYGRVDDYASPWLKELRREIQLLEEKIKMKAEALLKSQKAAMADSFIVTRNGRVCLPVKKECKGRIPGQVIDKSATGATVFIEPESVGSLREELEQLQVEEDNEVRRILYTLAGFIADRKDNFFENIRMILKLDFIFSKGKLSAFMNGTEPLVGCGRYLKIVEGRHPELEEKSCVPLNFEMKEESRGMIITGPNTGGKTVSIKTVGLFTLMACTGLHLPCKEAVICMRSQVLCDIGDGQNIADNLSTFSAHISNVISILKRADKESLVILDELGSGTDPAEGMGIAIAILEELRKSGCLFLVTTHYPEVKEYAGKHEEIISARMGFDREKLKPLYRLEIGRTGESCALYIAKRLGLPASMIEMAAKEAYGEKGKEIADEIIGKGEQEEKKEEPVFRPGIRKMKQTLSGAAKEKQFCRGDSVLVYPEKKTGIVVRPEDEKGNVLVQLQKEKKWLNIKRLKLQVAASALYPEDYDFSIIFDTVENRKAKHKIDRAYREGVMVEKKEIDDWE